jgi:hypothetical protein
MPPFRPEAEAEAEEEEEIEAEGEKGATPRTAAATAAASSSTPPPPLPPLTLVAVSEQALSPDSRLTSKLLLTLATPSSQAFSAWALREPSLRDCCRASRARNLTESSREAGVGVAGGGVIVEAMVEEEPAAEAVSLVVPAG